ncbi:hypothetical protein CYMTET_3369 [Cymbomonas tetramitiformis]|uniref:Protein kinase domain-containing protein n=1 Tax=Cymbomonas tetramitiformis TaxID=36881 RepID=A0AAE0H3K2_9CHLO|nr:hypothetical protein CYMTET_3369 [Cymbomonas tetramitiformis]
MFPEAKPKPFKKAASAFGSIATDPFKQDIPLTRAHILQPIKPKGRKSQEGRKSQAAEVKTVDFDNFALTTYSDASASTHTTDPSEAGSSGRCGVSRTPSPATQSDSSQSESGAPAQGTRSAAATRSKGKAAYSTDLPTSDDGSDQEESACTASCCACRNVRTLLSCRGSTIKLLARGKAGGRGSSWHWGSPFRRMWLYKDKSKEKKKGRRTRSRSAFNEQIQRVAAERDESINAVFKQLEEKGIRMFQLDQIKFGAQAGSGAFSVVRRAHVTLGSEVIEAAVKTLKLEKTSSSHPDCSCEYGLNLFEKEAMLHQQAQCMKNQTQRCVVALMGVAYSMGTSNVPNLHLVQHLMGGRDLNHMIRHPQCWQSDSGPTGSGSQERKSEDSNPGTPARSGKKQGYPYGSYVLRRRVKLRVSIQLAAMLDRLIKHRIVHLDIKPGNILLKEVTESVLQGEDVEASLCDFGTSQVEHAKLCRKHLVGTAGYMAPELKKPKRGVVATHMADVFSAGVTILELFVGVIWRGEDASDSVCHQQMVDALRKLQHSDARVARIIKKCLAPKPQDRPKPKELQEMLQAVLDKHCANSAPSPKAISIEKEEHIDLDHG